MNVFVTDSDPVLAAQALDDRRVIKMCLETGQLLSSALYKLGYWKSNLYKETHVNHPCVRWAADSRGNFQWLILHGLGLNEEYRYRFGSISHKSAAVILNASERFKDCRLDRYGMSPWCDCTGITGNISTIKKYRQCLIQKWRNDPNPRWTRRGKPNWYKDVIRVSD